VPRLCLLLLLACAASAQDRRLENCCRYLERTPYHPHVYATLMGEVAIDLPRKAGGVARVLTDR
jgi:hypothetical protein